MKALALVESPDHVCARYRVSAFAPAMVAAGWSMAVEGLASSPIGRVRQLRRAGRYDAVILQRKLLPSWQVALLRAASRRLIYDFDDAVLYRDSYDPRGPRCRRRLARFAAICRAADVVVAGNGFLAECASKHGAGGRTRVIPSCVEADRYAPSERSGDGVRLVWVGSSSTLQGLERKRGMLERIGAEIPKLSLRVVADRFPDFGPLRVEAVPWTEAGEAAAIADSDIGVSWIPDDLWSRGKCGLKVLQYQAAGLPVVANPVGVHPEMITPMIDGFLATSDDGWVAAVRTLAESATLRRRMGRAARANVEARYSVDAWAARFVAAVAGSSSVPAPSARRVGQAVAR